MLTMNRRSDGLQSAETVAPSIASFLLIARSKLRSHAEGSAQFATGRNDLNPLFVLERTLVMVIGQTPARLDAQEWAAIGPQRHVGKTGQIHHHPAPARWVNIRKLRPPNIHQLEEDGTRQLRF